MMSETTSNMTSDKQQQEEELLILKSILGDEIVELGNENDQYEINIEFQLPSTFSLRLLDHSNQLTTSIQYLPPLILTVNYHEQYPSSIDPPTFVLASCYLSRRYLQTMCRVLDRIWEENISQPIVYLWIENLKEQLLSTDELCLTDDEIDDEEEDPRAMSSYDPNQASYVYEQLIEYNREKANEKFLNEYHECPICMSNDIYGRDMIQLNKCQHFFCRICLHDYAQMQINTGSVEWLLCPDSQCQLTLFPWEIKIIVDNDQLYDKYERLLLQKTLEQMQDIFWCPRCQQAVLTGNADDNLALCDQCRFAFCKKCKKTYHSQTLCPDELNTIELRKRQQELRRHMQALNITADEEKKLLNDILAAARIENSTRLCPNLRCQVPIEKNMGCDHMFCTRCKMPFNWSSARDQTSDAKVLLENNFDELLEKLAREKAGSEILDNSSVSKLQLINKLLVKRTKKCPNPRCKKMNVKSGTGNYLICEYCKRGFCFSCGQSISNPNTHFGHACKRHEPA